MAFLTKSERTVIAMINSNEELSVDKRAEMVQTINYNARLRQDGYRLPVREFIQAMAKHVNSKIYQSIK